MHAPPRANSIAGYHAHVYFDESTAASAQGLRQRIADELRGQVRVHGLIGEPIGPHPLPMFEIDVPAGRLEALMAWLMLNHGPHSVLIHPITGDDLKDHSDHPAWIGPPLPLRLDILERMTRKQF
jgi:aromatic ring-cleaving dioxygenase